MYVYIRTSHIHTQRQKRLRVRNSQLTSVAAWIPVQAHKTTHSKFNIQTRKCNIQTRKCNIQTRKCNIQTRKCNIQTRKCNIQTRKCTHTNTQNNTHPEAKDPHAQIPEETYNTLLNALAKSARYKEALQVVKEMQRNQVQRSVITWNSVMDAVANEAALGRLSGAQSGREVMQVWTVYIRVCIYVCM
jgi:pentatricopeptide repeat protein